MERTQTQVVKWRERERKIGTNVLSISLFSLIHSGKFMGIRKTPVLLPQAILKVLATIIETKTALFMHNKVSSSQSDLACVFYSQSRRNIHKSIAPRCYTARLGSMCEGSVVVPKTDWSQSWIQQAEGLLARFFGHMNEGWEWMHWCKKCKL